MLGLAISIAGPLSPPMMIPFLESTRRPAHCLLSPWHWMQRSIRNGRIFCSKKSIDSGEKLESEGASPPIDFESMITSETSNQKHPDAMCREKTTRNMQISESIVFTHNRDRSSNLGGILKGGILKGAIVGQSDSWREDCRPTILPRQIRFQQRANRRIANDLR